VIERVQAFANLTGKHRRASSASPFSAIRWQR
jgi:hypothetical protein